MFSRLLMLKDLNDAGDVSRVMRETWENPSDTLSILLIIGGDVVAKALAQLTGSVIVPIPFSFGWVAYSFSTLMSVFGDGRLVPKPDYDAKLFNLSSGIPRDNRSWVLGRFLRDMEVKHRGPGLAITIYRVTRGGAAVYDWWDLSGIIVIVIQLAVAAIPLGLDGDYSTLIVTGIGTALALLTGALPQWHAEKFSARHGRKKVVAITGGNGSRNVLVIINSGVAGSVDLEDLASSPSLRVSYSHPKSEPTVFGLPSALRFTQLACVVLAVGWIMLLLIATGLMSHAWFMPFIGGIGMLHNVLAAGAQRPPSASMIHIAQVDEIRRPKYMHTLMDAERAYPRLGKTLLPEFFAEGMRDDEQRWWDGARDEYDAKRKETKFLADESVTNDIRYARQEYLAVL